MIAHGKQKKMTRHSQARVVLSYQFQNLALIDVSSWLQLAKSYAAIIEITNSGLQTMPATNVTWWAGASSVDGDGMGSRKKAGCVL